MWKKPFDQKLFQLSFTCLKSTTETLENGVKNVFKFNNKNAKTTSMT